MRPRTSASTNGRRLDRTCRKSRSTAAMPVMVAPVPCRAALERSMIVWMPGSAPSIAGNASTNAFGPSCQIAVAPTRPGTALSRAATSSASPPRSTSTSSGFITPGLMPAAASWSRPSIAVPLPGKFFSGASVALSWRAETGEHGDDRQADARRRRPGGAARSAPSGPTRRPPADPWTISRRGITGKRLMRSPTTASMRGQQRERGEHRDGGDQHAADAHRADQRQRQRDHAPAGRSPRSSPRRSPSGRRGSSSSRAPPRRRGRRAARRGSGRSSAARSRSRCRARRARSGTGR